MLIKAEREQAALPDPEIIYLVWLFIGEWLLNQREQATLPDPKTMDLA